MSGSVVVELRVLVEGLAPVVQYCCPSDHYRVTSLGWSLVTPKDVHICPLNTSQCLFMDWCRLPTVLYILPNYPIRYALINVGWDTWITFLLLCL
jgi:hypothetical protein